jgi:hypothetical protein
MIDPMQISEAINNTVGFYLWTRFATETLTGMLVVGTGVLLFWLAWRLLIITFGDSKK